MPEPSPRDDLPEADAASLLGDDPRLPGPAPAIVPPASAPDPYALVDPEETVIEPPRPPVPPRGSPAPKAATSPPANDAMARPMRTLVDDAPRVEQVWSRGAEWGPDLAKLAAVLFAAGFVIRLALSAESWTLAFLLLVAGGVAALVFAYPIVITLERPVRVTPEQAAKDFYAALSHHRPHYRRMWLLLSASGRTSGPFASFEGFRAYWKLRLDELRGPGATPWTPLQFEVVDFTSGKSAGQSEVTAKFGVQVFRRGGRGDGPIASHRVDTTMAKGPDRMWYLDRGTLPE